MTHKKNSQEEKTMEENKFSSPPAEGLSLAALTHVTSVIYPKAILTFYAIRATAKQTQNQIAISAVLESILTGAFNTMAAQCQIQVDLKGEVPGPQGFLNKGHHNEKDEYLLAIFLTQNDFSELSRTLSQGKSKLFRILVEIKNFSFSAHSLPVDEINFSLSF